VYIGNYLKSVLRYFGHYMYVSRDVRILGYFFGPTIRPKHVDGLII